MLGCLAKAIETTREAPEKIGTAFKTIFARMSELKDFGKTLEDGMEVSRVDTALKTIGVELLNNNNELRNLDEVLIEVGQGWSNMNKNQKAYIATALAGTRQQTRLLAVMEDFDRTMELTEVSASSLGAALAQQSKYYNSFAYATNLLKVAWQDFITNVVENEFLILLANGLTSLVEVMNSVIKVAGGVGLAFLSLSALVVKQLISGIIKYTASMYSNIVVTNQQIAAEALRTTNLASSTAAQTVLTKVTNADTVAKLLNVKANKAMLAGMIKMTLVSGGIVLAIAAVAAGVWALYNAFKSADKKVKEFNETQQKLSAEAYNLDKEVKSVEELTRKYEELDNKLYKTNEELKEMGDLLQRIQDITGDGINVSTDGKINLPSIASWISEQEVQLNKVWKEIGEGFEDNIQSNYDNATVTVKEQAKIWLAYQYARQEGLVKEVSDFEKLSSEQRKFYTDMASIDLAAGTAKTIESISTNLLGTVANLNNISIEDSSDPLYGYIRDAESQLNVALKDEDYDKVNQIINDLNNKLKEAGLNTILVNNETKNLAKAAELITDEFANMDIAQQKTLVNSLKLTNEELEMLKNIRPEIANYIDTVAFLGGEFDKVANSVGISSKMISNLKDELSNIPVFENNQDSFESAFRILLTGEIEKAFDLFRRSIDSSANSLEDIIDAANAFTAVIAPFTTLDLTNMGKSLNAVQKNLTEVNDMLSGATEFNLSRLEEMMNMYPQITDMILEQGTITEEGIKGVAKAEKEAFLLKLENQKQAAQIELANLNIQIANMALVYQQLKNRYGEELDLSQITAEEIARIKLAIEKNVAEDVRELNAETARESLESYADYMSAIDPELANFARNQAANIRYVKDQVVVGSGKAFEEAFNTSAFDSEMNALLNQAQTVRNTITALEVAISLVHSRGNFLGNDKQSAAAKDYEAQLDEIYSLTQQLAALQESVEDFGLQAENAKTGEDYVKALRSQNVALEASNEITQALINAQNKQKNSLQSSLGPLRNHVAIINGRMVPVIAKYNRASSQSQEIIDQTIESYNALEEGVRSNTRSLEENTAAIEANNRELRDKTIELYELVIDALKNSEKKKLDLIKKGIAEEKKLLDNRRKMYEESFAEEDYEDSLAGADEERQSIIEELATLEGATDLSSLQRREELLKKKADLDKEYNNLVKDYNRDALLDSLTQEEEALDKREENAQEFYDQYINNMEALEAAAADIIEQGTVAILDFLATNSEEYAGSMSLVQEDLMTKWGLLADQVEAAFSEQELPDFTSLLQDLADAASGYGNLKGAIDSANQSAINLANNIRKAGEAGQMKIISTNANNAFTGDLAEGLAKGYISARDLGVKGHYLTAYADGGMNTKTGPAWLDGTPQRPEAVLDPIETELFKRMVATLEADGSTTNNESITIGNVTISTPQLNTNADFMAAGRTLAAELQKAMGERGININRKK